MDTRTHELRAFGKLSDVVPARSFVLPVHCTVSHVRDLLESQYPGLRSTVYRIAVDHELARDNQVLHEKQVIALLPPFSGG